MSASSGGKEKTKAQKVLMRLVIVSILLAAGGVYAYFNLPSYWREKWAVETKADAMHVGNAAKLERETNPKLMKQWVKDVDVSGFAGGIMPSATRARDLVRATKAWDARAGDRDEAIPQAEVLGNQSDWITVREIRVPTRITVDPYDQITPYFRKGEKTNADGTPFRVSRKRDRTVLGRGNVNELIGRFCDEHGCRAGLTLGTDSVVCVGPGYFEGGNFQSWHNGLAVLGRLETKLDFANGSGKFRLQIQPDRPEKGETFATDVCNANPGALVVKKPGLQTTN